LVDDIYVLLQSLVDMDVLVCLTKTFFEPRQDMIAVGNAVVFALMFISGFCLTAIGGQEEENVLPTTIILNAVSGVIVDLIISFARFCLVLDNEGARQNSSKVGTPRCGVRTAQRAVPTQGNEEFCPAPR
jgi:hypothetical protein